MSFFSYLKHLKKAIKSPTYPNIGRTHVGRGGYKIKNIWKYVGIYTNQLMYSQQSYSVYRIK